MTAQQITELREALLIALLPLTAIATYPVSLQRALRRRGFPDLTEEQVTAQLRMLHTLGKVEEVKADRAAGTLSAADKGWKLTAAGVQTAEELAYS